MAMAKFCPHQPLQHRFWWLRSPIEMVGFSSAPMERPCRPPASLVWSGATMHEHLKGVLPRECVSRSDGKKCWWPGWLCRDPSALAFPLGMPGQASQRLSGTNLESRGLYNQKYTIVMSNIWYTYYVYARLCTGLTILGAFMYLPKRVVGHWRLRSFEVSLPSATENMINTTICIQLRGFIPTHY